MPPVVFEPPSKKKKKRKPPAAPSHHVPHTTGDSRGRDGRLRKVRKSYLVISVKHMRICTINVMFYILDYLRIQSK